MQVSIYHLLSAAFGQGVAIAQIVDLNVLDEITILLVDLRIERRSGGGSRGRFGGAGAGGADGRDVYMLRALLLGQLCVDLGRRRRSSSSWVGLLDVDILIAAAFDALDGGGTALRGVRASIESSFLLSRRGPGLVESRPLAWFFRHGVGGDDLMVV